MTRLLILAMAAATARALPRFMNESMLCARGRCDESDDYEYEIRIPSQPGYQWDDAGGYCGSWAVQRIALAKGAWISQQQVRDHTEDCGGHDEEILSCNIDEALQNLKIDYEAFDYTNTPTPQTWAYNTWLKAQLAAGHPVAWMILWDGQQYPIYDLTPPAGMYGHVEPVIGLQSNHPLTDTEVYDDDMVLHYTDGGVNTVHRLMSTLAGNWSGPGSEAVCPEGYSYCIGNPYGFGWAAKGFTNDTKADVAVAASLHVNPWTSEPDTRAGEDPGSLRGTLTLTGLTPGASYAVYRWDSVEDAFQDYSDGALKATITATKDTYTYLDDAKFSSDGTTYYRAVAA